MNSPLIRNGNKLHSAQLMNLLSSQSHLSWTPRTPTLSQPRAKHIVYRSLSLEVKIWSNKNPKSSSVQCICRPNSRIQRNHRWIVQKMFFQFATQPLVALRHSTQNRGRGRRQSPNEWSLILQSSRRWRNFLVVECSDDVVFRSSDKQTMPSMSGSLQRFERSKEVGKCRLSDSEVNVDLSVKASSFWGG